MRPGGNLSKDPVLRDLIHEALRNNYDVRIAPPAACREARRALSPLDRIFSRH